MSFPHEGLLHATPCDCTAHDIGFHCQSKKLTEDDFRRSLFVLLSDASRSGLSRAQIDQALTAVRRVLEKTP